MNKDEKKVVSVSTKKEVVVQKPKVEDFDVSKSLEEHMEENKANVKTKIDYKSLIMYIIMTIIVVACILLLVHFCEKSIDDLNNKTTTTNLNYELIKTTDAKTSSVEYVRPSTVPTAATHTVFVGNTSRVTNTKDYDRTNNVQKKTTKATTTAKSTESTTTTTTEETTKKTEEETTTTTTTTTTTKTSSEEPTGEN